MSSRLGRGSVAARNDLALAARPGLRGQPSLQVLTVLVGGEILAPSDLHALVDASLLPRPRLAAGFSERETRATQPSVWRPPRPPRAAPGDHPSEDSSRSRTIFPRTPPRSSIAWASMPDNKGSRWAITGRTCRRASNSKSLGRSSRRGWGSSR